MSRQPRDLAPSRAGPKGTEGAEAAAVEDEQDEAPPAPWHFKLLLVGTAGYLVYRLVWFIFWLTGHGWHG